MYAIRSYYELGTEFDERRFTATGAGPGELEHRRQQLAAFQRSAIDQGRIGIRNNFV